MENVFSLLRQSMNSHSQRSSYVKNMPDKNSSCRKGFNMIFSLLLSQLYNVKFAKTGTEKCTRKWRMCYFNTFSAILLTSLSFIYIYCRYIATNVSSHL